MVKRSGDKKWPKLSPLVSTAKDMPRTTLWIERFKSTRLQQAHSVKGTVGNINKSFKPFPSKAYML